MKYARVTDESASIPEYIEMNRLYEITEYDGDSFVISKEQTPSEGMDVIDDEDTFCNVEGCPHIGGANWELFETKPREKNYE